MIYLGHGNGWPSRYRGELYPPTQNGFGLNPVAGSGNDAHQYFGEGRIAAEVKLAKDAIVLLHNLCYASGNTEPGLPVGTIDESRQRVDNYAAGFIKSGASAVVAEAFLSPAWYVRQILSSNRTIERIWRAAPTYHGNTFTFESRRSPGFVAAMDPEQADSGFYRSLVTRGGLRGSDLKAGAVGPQPDVAPVPAEPTLVGSGLEMKRPYFKGRPLAGANVELWIPYTQPAGSKLATSMTVGIRWDPIELEQPGAAAAPGTGEPGAVEPGTIEPAAGESGTAGTPGDDAPIAAAPDASQAPATVPDQPPGPAAGEPFSIVQSERLGTLVDPVRVTAGVNRIKVPVTVPAEAGRYRLLMTLHDATGVAFDAATQALLPGLLVRVAGDIGAMWLVEPARTVVAGARLELPVAVANIGARTWGAASDAGVLRRRDEPPSLPLIVAHWIRLAPAVDTTLDTPDMRVRLAAVVEGGVTARVVLAGDAPATPGQYLVVIDVIVPGYGSLAAGGAQPALVRVIVE